jgi:hypothetical protein
MISNITVFVDGVAVGLGSENMINYFFFILSFLPAPVGMLCCLSLSMVLTAPRSKLPETSRVTRGVEGGDYVITILKIRVEM